MNERNALQVTVALAGLVPVTAGAMGVLKPELLAFAGTPSSLTHAAYLSGLLLGVGLTFWSLIPSIEKHARLVLALTIIIVVGGLARSLMALRLGAFGPTVTLPLAMELIVTPALCLWQRRIARQVA